jgi:anti-anti-sigma factor
VTEGDGTPIRHERRDSAVIVKVGGDVDIANAAGLSARIGGLIGNEELGIVLDLSETRYLDSAGIRMVFHLSEKLSSRGQRLYLVVGRDQPAREALTLFEVQRVAPIVESLEEGMALLNGSKPSDTGESSR